jgi:hypothetical protein
MRRDQNGGVWREVMSREVTLNMSAFIARHLAMAFLREIAVTSDEDGNSQVPGIEYVQWIDWRPHSEAFRARGASPAGVFHPSTVIMLKYSKVSGPSYPAEPVYRLALALRVRFGGWVEVLRHHALQLLLSDGHLLVPPGGELLADEHGDLLATLLKGLSR